MAFCTNCGAEVSGPFCGKCGAPAPRSTPAQGGMAPSGGAPAGSGAPTPPTFSTPAGPPPVQPAPAAAAAKTSPLIWILAGCGGLIVLCVIVFGMITYYAAHKARQFAKNPALAISRMIAAANPDLDVVSVDEAKGVITVRDKKSGETVTMNFEDAQKGKFVFKGKGNETVTMEAHGSGENGSLEVKSSEGTMKIGGVAQLPDWLPAYPGSTPQPGMSAQTDKGNSAIFSFKTKDPIDQVVRYYEDALKKAGLKVNTNVMQQDGKPSLGIVTAEDSATQRKASVTATLAAGVTNVGVTVETKK